MTTGSLCAPTCEPDQIPDGWWFYDGENRHYPGPGNRTDPYFFHIEPGCTWEYGVTKKYDNSAFFAEWIGRSKEFPQGTNPYQFSCEHYAPYQQLHKVVCKEYSYRARKDEKIDRYYCSAKCASDERERAATALAAIRGVNRRPKCLNPYCSDGANFSVGAQYCSTECYEKQRVIIHRDVEENRRGKPWMY